MHLFASIYWLMLYKCGLFCERFEGVLFWFCILLVKSTLLHILGTSCGDIIPTSTDVFYYWTKHLHKSYWALASNIFNCDLTCLRELWVLNVLHVLPANITSYAIYLNDQFYQTITLHNCFPEVPGSPCLH